MTTTAQFSRGAQDVLGEPRAGPLYTLDHGGGGAQDRDKRRQRILWLIKGLGYGGAEQLLVNLARVHDSNRFEIAAAYFIPQLDALVGDLEAAGVEVRCLTHPSKTGSRHGGMGFGWARALRRWMVTEPFDVLHVHLHHPATVGRLVARSLAPDIRPAIVSTEHNICGDTLVGHLGNALTAGLDDRTIAVSEAVLEAMSTRRALGAKTIVHGIDLEAVERSRSQRQCARRSLGATSHEILVGTVANLRPQKAYDVLLRAAHQVTRSLLNVRFIAVGGGSEEASLHQLHKELGLGSRFEFLGPRHDVLDLLAAFDIFCLSSTFEGLPVALMEALAMGLPIVATAVGGIPSAVTHGSEGLLVAPGRPDLLGDALAELSTNHLLRAKMGAAARARGAHFDVANAARQIEQIYLDLAAQRQGAILDLSLGLPMEHLGFLEGVDAVFSRERFIPSTVS